MRFLTCFTLLVALVAIFLFNDADASHSRHQGRSSGRGRGIVSQEDRTGGHGGHRGRGIVSQEDRTGGHGGNRRPKGRGAGRTQGRGVVITNRNGMKITAPDSAED